jgi:hypothetical protein
MAWTYGGDPSANARDAIRFLIGDTDTGDQLLLDAEVAWVNNQVTGSDTATTGLYDAAYRCCLMIASKFSRLADKSVGDLRVDMAQKAKSYRDQAAELKSLAQREGLVPTPYAGGMTISDKDIDRENSDMVQPSFWQGQFDDYGTTTGQIQRWAGAN